VEQAYRRKLDGRGVLAPTGVYDLILALLEVLGNQKKNEFLFGGQTTVLTTIVANNYILFCS